jgi:hypothetical protein
MAQADLSLDVSDLSLLALAPSAGRTGRHLASRYSSNHAG